MAKAAAALAKAAALVKAATLAKAAALAKAKAAAAAYKQEKKEQAIRRNAESKRQHHIAQAAKWQAEIDAVSSAVRNDWMQIPLETKAKYGCKVKNAQVCFYYGKKRAATPPHTLNMIARLLAAGVVESSAEQVTVNHIAYDYPTKYVRKNLRERHKSADPANQDHVDTLASMLRRAERI